MKKNSFYLMSMALVMFSFINVMKTEAQVTIGEAAPPHPASILDLRTSKGLLLSKAHLEDAAKFQLSAGKTKEAAGMIIYNTNPDMKGGYGAGLYLWNGSHWDFIEENEMPEIDCKEAPSIISIDGFSTTVNLNGTFNVTCDVSTSGNTTYTWTVPQGLEISGDQNKQTITLTAKTSGSYNGGNLVCAVVNACGGGSSIAGASKVLIVNDCEGAPVAGSPEVSLSDATKYVGETLTATANVTTTGNTSYAWTIAPQNGSPNDGMTIAGANNTTAITLNGVKAGTYTVNCTVTNACGNITLTSGIITIAVSEGPIKEGGYEGYCFPISTGLPCWMIENSRLGTPSATYYDTNQSSNRGYYYTHANATLKDNNGHYTACPTGWELPTSADMIQLRDYINNTMRRDLNSAESGYWINAKSYAGYRNTIGGWNSWGERSYFWGTDYYACISHIPPSESLSVGAYPSAGVTNSYYSVRCIKRR